MRKFVLFFAVVIALSANAAHKKDSVNGRYYRLFAPLTFYHSVAADQLSIASDDPDEVNKAINEALMQVYLTRPDLVRVTESQQQESGTLRQDIIEQPVVQQIGRAHV